MRSAKHLKTFVTVSLVLSIIAFLIVILQNLGIVPFLWGETYKKIYHSFLSGTFGPNKIVSGMSALIMSVLSIGLINTKGVTISRGIIYTNLCLALLALMISGSRTAYVGLGVFLLYFAIRQPFSIVYSSIGLGFFLTLLAVTQPGLLQKTIEVYENRVEKKISDEEDLKNANVNQLYEDLGAGRNRLLVYYSNLLAEEYYFLPLGRGFNNRILTGSSAHNMYLSLIYEVGLVGVIMYVRWLILYLFVRMRRLRVLETTLHGLILSMLVTLFFGEHLYVYRALFGLAGLFLFVATVLTSPLFLAKSDPERIQNFPEN
ncbi:MAG: O-antigen ligase family protein [Flavobacterium sp.]|nr:O-antigen ligase family protein [Flavobacterium sp.]